MRRNYGSPGRVDLSSLAPTPAERFVHDKAHTLGHALFWIVVVILGAAAVLALLRFVALWGLGAFAGDIYPGEL